MTNGFLTLLALNKHLRFFIQKINPRYFCKMLPQNQSYCFENLKSFLQNKKFSKSKMFNLIFKAAYVGKCSDLKKFSLELYIIILSKIFNKIIIFMIPPPHDVHDLPRLTLFLLHLLKFHLKF